ncbi:MAG: hypothetical protein ACYDAC_08265 [Candidatus Dormibacteria bacterium]
MRSARRRSAALSSRQQAELVDEVSAVCRRFMADVGAILAGSPDGLDDHVERSCAESLRGDLASVPGVALAPDFGEWAQLTIEGPLSARRPLTAHVDFADATSATHASGRPLRVAHHDIRVSLVIDPVTMRVGDAWFSVLP